MEQTKVPEGLVEGHLTEPVVVDNVNHPQHYGGKDNPYEHVKVAEAWGLVGNAFLYNCTKYISRLGKKRSAGALEDLKKARWYLDREIQRVEAMKP